MEGGTNGISSPEFAVAGIGAAFGDNLIPSSLVWHNFACVPQVSPVPPINSSIFCSDLIGPYVDFAFDSCLGPILLLSNVGALWLQSHYVSWGAVPLVPWRLGCSTGLFSLL